MLNGVAIVLPYDDGTLQNSDQIKFEVADLIRAYKPDLLITHWKNSMHKDHETTHLMLKTLSFMRVSRGLKEKILHILLVVHIMQKTGKILKVFLLMFMLKYQKLVLNYGKKQYQHIGSLYIVLHLNIKSIMNH